MQTQSSERHPSPQATAIVKQQPCAWWRAVLWHDWEKRTRIRRINGLNKRHLSACKQNEVVHYTPEWVFQAEYAMESLSCGATPSPTPLDEFSANATLILSVVAEMHLPRSSSGLGILTVRSLPRVERLERLSRWPCCHLRAQVFAVCTVFVLLVLLCTLYPYLKKCYFSDVGSCEAPYPSSGRSVLGAETTGCKGLSSSSSAMEPAEGTPATATTTTAETAAATATATAAATATEATAAAATAPSSEVRASIELELASGRSSSGCPRPLWQARL